jgi:predicted membrane-bound spermidine synthase
MTSVAKRIGRVVETAARQDVSDVRPLPFPEAFAFVGSGCLLVLEIVAGRVISPQLGNSLYTWTSVIGVVLAGLSLGNWVGGRIADWRPGRSVLSLLYLLSGLSAGLVLVLSRSLDSIAAPVSWGPEWQVLWLAAVLFLLPSVLLGTLTPMIVKLSLSSLQATGRVVGQIQAAATLGSIVGVFATGFFLISAFGTRPVMACVAIALLALAVLSNPFWQRRRGESALAVNVALASVIAAVFIVGVAATYDSPCFKESKYYCIGVFQEGPYKVLALDMLIHGYVSVEDPSQPIYPYEKVYRAVLQAKYDKRRPLEGFGIGGGAFTFPRYLERNHHGHTLIAEIDEEVTKTAREEFFFEDTPAVEVLNQDARPALRDRPKSEKYDVVLGDAFGDIAIPYHLATREFNDLVASRLKPDGVYLVTVVDGVDYDFLRSYIKTMRLSLPYVDLVAVPGEAGGGARATFVVAASPKPIPRIASTASPEQLGAFLAERNPVTLTDDHVPVDQLLAPVFRQRLTEDVGGGPEAGHDL